MAGNRAYGSGAARLVERDIAEVAAYWGRRKLGWLDRASEEFDALVMPYTFHVMDVTGQDIQAVNGYFTEWFLFERPLHDGKTPLELYIDQKPGGADAERLRRLQQVRETQFFARFAIEEKIPSAHIAQLCDVQTGRRYEVFDPVVCSQGRWRDGTISQRIACVDGMWQVVGQARLYDKASPGSVGADGPGAVHPEDAGRDPSTADMGLYLRLLRDVIGIYGRYAPTFRLRTLAQ